MSEEKEDLRIKMLMESLKTSTIIPPTKKQDLTGDLQHAQEINGDPSRQTSKRILLTGVAREIESYGRHEDLKRELAEIVGAALADHSKNCVFVLTKAKAEEDAKRRMAAASVVAAGEAAKSEEEAGGSSLKMGEWVEAKGVAATVFAAVAAVVVVAIGCVMWQNSKTQDVIKASVAEAVRQALSGE